MKILIVYGTGEGQTRKIARFMEQELQEDQHQVVIADATEEPPSPEGYDLVMVGSSIHMHKYHKAIFHYAKNYAGMLNELPTAFFSVCMAVASDLPEEHEEAHAIAKKFLHDTGWEAEEVFHIAGALKYTQYDYFKRLIMRMIAKKQGGAIDTSKDHEYTDWKAVAHFVKTFADSHTPVPLVTDKQ